MLANASDRSPLQRPAYLIRQQAGSYRFWVRLRAMIVPGAVRQPAVQANFAPPGTATLGFLNTNTFPAITSTSPINAGAVH